jgi:hypothetical protein
MRIITALGLAAVTLLPAEAGRVITVHYTPHEQQAVRYEYVPFTVAPGTTQISIGYTYNKADGANVVDLGLYEPGPLALGTKALRGWSGGDQDSITIGVADSSPGYWPGPIPAGEWHVQLGLYKVGPSGVDVQVTIGMSDAPVSGNAPKVRTPTTAALRTGPAWYAGSMHTHTKNSDGILTPEQLSDKARGEGLDFLVITDHNNTVHQIASLDRPDLLVITGEEVTTPGGHFNVWGLSGERAYIDFRILPGDPAIRTVMKDARARGALVSINHPISDCFACTWTHEIPPEVNAMEIANGPAAMRQQQMTLWDSLLREGRRITAVGESDWHRGPLPVSMPSVRVWAPELSTKAILDAVRDGHVIVMANGKLQTPDFSVTSGGDSYRAGDELTTRAGEPLAVRVKLPGAGYEGAHVDLVWRGEVVDSAKPADGEVRFDRFPPFSGYLRAHVVSAEGMLLAVTNPVFVKVAPR